MQRLSGKGRTQAPYESTLTCQQAGKLVCMSLSTSKTLSLPYICMHSERSDASLLQAFVVMVNVPMRYTLGQTWNIQSL